jgi:hypothetical protein
MGGDTGNDQAPPEKHGERAITSWHPASDHPYDPKQVFCLPDIKLTPQILVGKPDELGTEDF